MARVKTHAFWAEERSDDGSQTPESLRSDSGQSLRARQKIKRSILAANFTAGTARDAASVAATYMADGDA